MTGPPSVRRRRWAGAPLFLQVLAFLLLAVAAAQALTAAIVVILPPPSPQVFHISELAAALRSGRSTDRLKVSVRDSPPAAPERAGRGRPRGPGPARRELAALLGAPDEAVRIAPLRARPLLDPMIRLELPRDQGPPTDRLRLRRGAFGGGDVLLGNVRVAVQRPDGRWTVVEPRQSGPARLWRQRLLIWVGVCTLLLTPLAWLLARRLARPIVAFAQAAERLGRDPRAPPLGLEGPAEVRTAVSAFNGMQDRLRRYIDDRTAMIGAVAHDLRTPLTRMRFLLEARGEDARDKMEREIDEMDAMIGAVLAFVKDASTSGERVVLDLGALVDSLAADLAETGANVTCEPCDRLLVRGDPLALRRMFANVIGNAVKFAGNAEISARLEGSDAVVQVADRGPGLPEGDLERVFDPFYRGEGSRSRDTGGIGLGLAVVRSAARAHGGDAVLANRGGGGLVCTIRIPAETQAPS